MQVLCLHPSSLLDPLKMGLLLYTPSLWSWACFRLGVNGSGEGGRKWEKEREGEGEGPRQKQFIHMWMELIYCSSPGGCHMLPVYLPLFGARLARRGCRGQLTAALGGSYVSQSIP